ncbi:MAG TPA: ribosome maturation factor RimM [Longimicrobiales bacterium]
MAASPADPENAQPRQEEPRHLVVGHISKPHGTRGEVFVWPLTDDPEGVFAVGEEVRVAEPDGAPEPDEEWQPLAVERRRSFKRGLLVKFEGLDDRNAVEPLAGRYILKPIEELAPLEEGEVFYHQLLDAEVVTVDGQVVGRVREVFETEPAHLLEVKGDDKLHLIPFTERIVKEIDVERKRLVIEPPAGLLEI